MQELIKLKDHGNQHFKQKNFQEAYKLFQTAINKIEQFQNKQYLLASTEAGKLYTTLLTNISLVCLNQKNVNAYAKGRQYATIALNIDPKNIKALYRRGLAFKQQAQIVQREKGQLEEGLLELYQKAKNDFQQLNILDRNNDVARQKLSETIKDVYRITMLKGKQIKFTNDKTNQKQQTINKNNKSAYQYPKIPKKNNDMNKIMKQYKVEEVTQLVQEKVRKQYLSNNLPPTRSELQKAIRTLQKNQQVFLQFVYRMDLDYLNQVNPTFDMLAQLLNVILNKGQAQHSKIIIKAIRDHKNFQLLWKSYINKQKQLFKTKWVKYGLSEQDLNNLK